MRFLKLLLCLLLSLVFLPGRVTAESIPVDGYAAMVNARVITVGDVLGFIQPVEEQLRETYSGQDLDAKLMEAYNNGRDSLIERALILEDFAAQEGYLPDRVVDNHINDIIRERFDSDRSAFLEALAKERITFQEWTDQVKDRLVVIVSRRQNVADRTVISPKAVHNLYQERLDQYRIPAKVKLRMIVINQGTSEEDMTVKQEEADRIIQKLNDGERFETLAETVSEGSKADRGGDWGWIEPTSLRAELAAPLENLKVGEHSDVITTDGAFYILKIEGKQEESVTPFKEVKAELEMELSQIEQERQYALWMKRLRNKYYVKLF